MSDEEAERTFWTRVDRFIDLANQESGSGDKASVSAALLYAAARHNAFLVASTAADQQQLRGEIDAAIQHNVERYREMLSANLSEYVEKFSASVEAQRKP